MAGSSSNNSSGIISGINMTPLVDIMLVLLIIFLVTARLTTTPPNAIPLDLPHSATGDAAVLTLAITMGKSGEIAVNGDRLASDNDLLPSAQAMHTQHPDVRAVIQADGKVLHERVIHVLDLLSQAGIGQIAFGVALNSSAPTP